MATGISLFWTLANFVIALYTYTSPVTPTSDTAPRNQKFAKVEDAPATESSPDVSQKQVTEKLEAVNETLGKMNTQLENVSGSVEKMEGRLEKLEAAKTEPEAAKTEPAKTGCCIVA